MTSQPLPAYGAFNLNIGCSWSTRRVDPVALIGSWSNGTIILLWQYACMLCCTRDIILYQTVIVGILYICWARRSWRLAFIRSTYYYYYYYMVDKMRRFVTYCKLDGFIALARRRECNNYWVNVPYILNRPPEYTCNAGVQKLDDESVFRMEKNFSKVNHRHIKLSPKWIVIDHGD